MKIHENSSKAKSKFLEHVSQPVFNTSKFQLSPFFEDVTAFVKVTEFNTLDNFMHNQLENLIDRINHIIGSLIAQSEFFRFRR